MIPRIKHYTSPKFEVVLNHCSLISCIAYDITLQCWMWLHVFISLGGGDFLLTFCFGWRGYSNRPMHLGIMLLILGNFLEYVKDISKFTILILFKAFFHKYIFISEMYIYFATQNLNSNVIR